MANLAQFAETIRSQRVALGLRQADLASRIGSSRRWVIALEQGRPGVELARVFAALAELEFELALTPVTKQREPSPGTSGVLSEELPGGSETGDDLR